jgi:hypothetical protein
MTPAAMVLNMLMGEYSDNSAVKFDNYPFPVIFEAWSLGKESAGEIKPEHKNLLSRVLKEMESFLGIDKTVIVCIDEGVDVMEELI